MSTDDLWPLNPTDEQLERLVQMLKKEDKTMNDQEKKSKKERTLDNKKRKIARRFEELETKIEQRVQAFIGGTAVKIKELREELHASLTKDRERVNHHADALLILQDRAEKAEAHLLSLQAEGNVQDRMIKDAAVDHFMLRVRVDRLSVFVLVLAIEVLVFMVLS